eukprot:TRINITY_DN32099_c0_g1_i2.p1 TRINITY_DN32099_c0_g1~~TRINITY_DN32099_c0_g1_i2.p1  ORF type:complete len:138 (+),score=13.17 TRINITY_DN32099_c0_g1_i2:82-495(+)
MLWLLLLSFSFGRQRAIDEPGFSCGSWLGSGHDVRHMAVLRMRSATRPKYPANLFRLGNPTAGARCKLMAAAEGDGGDSTTKFKPKFTDVRGVEQERPPNFKEIREEQLVVWAIVAFFVAVVLFLYFTKPGKLAGYG